MELLAALVSITFVDLILSGDNAVVIALASRNLPAKQRKRAILIGTAGAVLLRVTLATAATLLLQIPYMHLAGGAALVYVAIKLLAQEKSEVSCKEAASFMEAVKIIIVADAIMSLDNIIAIAGLANGHILLLLFGLGLSIPLVVCSSQIILMLMDKFPGLVYIGAGILGWTAAKMIFTTPELAAMFASYVFALEIALTGAILAIGHWLKTRQAAGVASVLPAEAVRDIYVPHENNSAE